MKKLLELGASTFIADNNSQRAFDVAKTDQIKDLVIPFDPDGSLSLSLSLELSLLNSLSLSWPLSLS